MRRTAIVALFILAATLRLVHLGYSDYQGDEIKALFNPKAAQSIQFFLEQRKGPAQFLVTAGLKLFTPDYRNRLLVRLPFALAGFGSVLVFYLAIKEIVSQKVAFYSTLFFATNGFFVAFSRLVQYQSLVIFFGLLAIWLTAKYTKTARLRYLVLAFMSWALSALAHYDAVFFAPIILGLLINQLFIFKDKTLRVVLFRHFLVAAAVFLVLAGVFYLPFIFNIAQSTADYWAGRISGNVSSKISSSRYLFSVYQPIYVLHLYTLLLIGGLAVAGLNLLNKFQLVNFPRLIWAILIWFLFPLLIIEVLIYIPGTHIYTYLIPGCLLMGFVLSYIEHLIAIYVKPLKPLIPVGLWIMTLFLFLQSYYIFVDHQSEYPWEQKRFLIWTLPKPTPIFHLSIFGFPYYRHWDEVGDYIAADQQADYYTTNERVSIARYHINLEKDGERAGYYVYIKQPQTFTDEITNEGIVNWVATHPPVAEFQNNSRVVTQIFLVNRNEPVTSSN